MIELLKDSILALQELRIELQGSVEDSVIQKLDEVIAKLQLLGENEPELQLNKWQLLILFAEALLLIPSVAENVVSLIRLMENAASH